MFHHPSEFELEQLARALSACDLASRLAADPDAETTLEALRAAGLVTGPEALELERLNPPRAELPGSPRPVRIAEWLALIRFTRVS